MLRNPQWLRIFILVLKRANVEQSTTLGIATISVVSGIGKGIRRLSEFCFGVGVFIMLAVFFLEDWW